MVLDELITTFWSWLSVVRVPLVVAAATVGLVSGIIVSRRRRQRRLVGETSAALQELERLNAQSSVPSSPMRPIVYSFATAVSSKEKYDRFVLADFMKSELLAREDEVVGEIRARRDVVQLYLAYEGEVGARVRSRLGSSGHPKVRHERYAVIERELFEGMVLPRPEPSANVTATVHYRTPQGRNTYSRSLTWDYDLLKQGLQWAREERKTMSTSQYLRQRERALMTPKVRVDVLRRDGYRCRMCGTSSAVAEMHIDHIVPVSKGGRTEMSNLQTLCQSCNLGKSNRFSG